MGLNYNSREDRFQNKKKYCQQNKILHNVQCGVGNGKFVKCEDC